MIIPIVNLQEEAEAVFRRMCGSDGDDSLGVRMLDSARKVLETRGEGAVVKVSYEILPWKNDFDCRFFQQIPEDVVGGMAAYAVTAGQWPDDTDPMSQLYSDMWGTAYAESAVNFVHGKVSAELQDKILSQPFGPGYFGMSMAETGKILEMAHGGEIGIHLTEDGTMMPQKSCTGIFLILTKQIEMSAVCDSCTGNNGGCRFCVSGEITV